ncbi:MAG TPA: SDR family oxidoreductase [Chitinophagaceae bacterium]|jgi:NAD(P)-dependent dehydrogenase (short-subunit alcohol dehydrogenase family)|nr:SDR family oxidoreductase [Chitinophagaceae bacterium]
MQLRNKTAVIYGASGAIGSAVALAFAKEGARVFITGKNKETIQALAKDIISKGGFADAQQVDALDQDAVNNHLKMLIEKEGKLDISFNAMGIPQTGVQGIPLLQLTPEGYMNPISSYSKSHFITATAAAKKMVAKKAGVILTLTAVPSVLAVPLVGGMAPAWASIEALTRTLAAEMGSQGIRVVCLRADGMPETDIITTVFGLHAKGAGMASNKEFQGLMESFTLLKRLPTLAELANTAVFIASDNASAITGTTINVTCGSVVD